ncbi:MAG TPA: MBL fold metallo-hydrolase [Rhodocyclaceae bacterium]|jgi:glyoxylase-like metal-dependent hydrolase (beta-lactamase superfamily II)|nr:MBL fold metallo-hydrolase [Rhodocyclaceae bacterium]
MSPKPITYPLGETLPEPGSTIELAPGVSWLRMPLPYSLNHINLWLLADGKDTWCAVDTGMAMGDVQTHWQQILATHKLSRQIVTHYHPDHLGLAVWLQEQTGASVSMTQGEYLTALAFFNETGNYSPEATSELFRRHGLSAERLAAMAARGNGYKRAVSAIPSSYSIIRDQQLIRIGAHEWRVIVGHGHCPEHAALYCAELGVLIGGDMMLPSISTNVAVFAPNPDDDSLTDFLNSIRAFTALPENTLVLPSHGRPFRGIHARVASLEKHHADRCTELVTACRTQAHTAASLLPILFSRDITDPHQTLFAMSEAIAHLNYLQQRGELIRTEDNGTLYYRAT